MKKLYVLLTRGYFLILFLLPLLQSQPAVAQSCPTNSYTTISNYTNTYYPGLQTAVSAGTKSIIVGSVTFGTTPISSGDILLVIQMQGAEFDSSNTNNYGDGFSNSGNGYFNNGALLVGKMEYVTAANSLSLTGGLLKLTNKLVNSYQSTPYGKDGQYTYQVIRVPTYFDLQLTATIHPPRWNGSTGGVLVLYASDKIDLNSQTIDASGYGFRGGGGRQLTGSGAGSSSDYRTLATKNANGSKGEGISGTPYYLNDSDVVLYSTGVEGYPSGSYGKGGPGTAGGGGTDGNPATNNDQNTGGGGGANIGAGGYGGYAWSSGLQTGGRPGAAFAQWSASRMLMGGGGGAGTTNNGTGTPGNGFASSGSAGGGMVIIMAGVGITGSGSILANGAAANSTVQNDGAGGAGAGGSILIYSANGITSNIMAQAKGGTGGINQGSGGDSHGPGGGGGGGAIYSNSTLAAASSVAGGVAGTTSGLSSNYGASNGNAGIIKTNITQSNSPAFPLNCVVLAVSFLEVSAVGDNGVVNVSWTVAREVNTTDYVVERSTDGSNFTAIGSTPYTGAPGTDNAYQFPDNGAYAIGGTIYYRIREQETGGQTVYSRVVSVRLGGLAGKLSVYPNPAQSVSTISFQASTEETVSLRLFDVRGNQLWTRQYEAQTGLNTVQIDCLSTLPEGVYLLQWSDGLKPEIVKLLVRH
jgi:hypothetical protein